MRLTVSAQLVRLPWFTRRLVGRMLPLAIATQLLVACGSTPEATAPDNGTGANAGEASSTGAIASNTPGSNTPGSNGSAATPLAPTPGGVTPPPSSSFELGLFNQEELFAAGSGGCGLSLRPTAEATQAQAAGEFLLFHGVDGSPMLMKINGKLVPFKLEEGRGPAFYGQTPSQTFSNAELKLIAIVDVEPGSATDLGEAKSMPISSGSVQLQAGPENIAIPVEGKAGC